MTFRQFVWLAFVHARSSPSTSTGLVTTLESRASPGKQVERPPHIDVRYERAGPLQRSKELVGLGDDSIMCVSSLRSKRLEVFG